MGDQADRLRELAGKRSRFARTWAVASGKGGVGKTNVTLNLGLALSQRGRRVVILDGDLGMANVDVLLGVYPRYSLLDVVSGERTLDEVMFEGPDRLQIIPGGSGIAELANLDGSQRRSLLEKLRLAEREIEFLIIDTAAGITQGVLSLLLAADEVVVVVTPEPTSLTDAYALIKVLSQSDSRCRINLVINRVAGATEAQQVLQSLNLVAGRFLGVGLRLLGFVNEDPAVGKAVACQRPLLLSYPRSPAARQFHLMAARLLGEESQVKAPRGGFFQRLLDLLG